MQNELLERELLNIKQGQGNYGDFEMLLGASDIELNKLKKLLPKNGKTLKGSKDPLPEDFVFRQNEFRSEDLEVEERALMNLAS